ncbi:MAG: hypothetical protein IH591_20855 [Bacteroidales bacterium]|nr:hypothetical protein [Bacteroidales bacterium]
MKRIRILLLITALATLSLQSQTVDSIRIEQAGDFIKIRFKILDSSPSETYRVRILCSIDGGMNNEIRSITGDIGDQVAGGKDEYWAVWDVLKDVEALGRVEFIVRAELVSAEKATTIPRKKAERGSIHIMGATDIYGFEDFLFGARIGVFDKWGVTASYTTGSIIDDFAEGSEGTDTKIPLFNATMGLVVKVAGDSRSGLYVLGGPAYAKLKAFDNDEVNSEPSYYDNYIGFNLGLMPYFGKLTSSIGISTFPYFNLENDFNLKNIFFSVALGVNF